MKIIIFILGSAILVFISRGSLRSARSHGFPRLLAWECMLALFLFNVDFWFIQPFAWNQIIAWALLFLSLIPLGYGVHFLRTRGRPAQQRAGDPALLAFEKTSQLVTTGIYHYIRHPLYCSLLLLTWGMYFKHPRSPCSHCPRPPASSCSSPPRRTRPSVSSSSGMNTKPTCGARRCSFHTFSNFRMSLRDCRAVEATSTCYET